MNRLTRVGVMLIAGIAMVTGIEMPGSSAPAPPLPNVDVCANVGRRISVSGCI